MAKKNPQLLDLVDIVLLPEHTISYYLYKIPTGRNRSKTKNTVVTFIKWDDGFVYQLAAPSREWLEGYIAAMATWLRSPVPITQEQFLEWGGCIKQKHGQYGPDLQENAYIGG